MHTFCDAVGIAKPVVLGHSMGGFVAMLYGSRHPGHAGALVLQSTCARFDLDRLVEGGPALPDGVRRLEVIPGAGHFPWLDAPAEYWKVIGGFVHSATSG